MRLCVSARMASVPSAHHLAANPAVRNSIAALVAPLAGTKIESTEAV
jgi:hypothetical protein